MTEPNKGGRPLRGDRPMIARTFLVDEGLWSRMRDRAAAEGVTAGEYLRVCLERRLARRPRSPQGTTSPGPAPVAGPDKSSTRSTPR